MADFTLTRPSQYGSNAFSAGADADPEVTEDDTAGTTWTVYLDSCVRPRHGGPPVGAEVTTVDADVDGVVTFTGLTAGTPYVAYALIGDTDQFVTFIP